MHHAIAPIPVRPWMLNGISERMIVSHYENNYGAALRRLNAVRQEQSDSGAMTPQRLRSLKEEELSAANSVTLHELYFGNLGGEGNKVPEEAAAVLKEHFTSVAAWREEFIAMARSISGESGWVLLNYSRREDRFWNVMTSDHRQAVVDAAPVLALDMFEHAYHLDFGANSTAYIDAFMRNIKWETVIQRMNAVRAGRTIPSEDPSDRELPSISVEELAARLASGEHVQVLDARPRHYISRHVDLMQGAVWRDPDRVKTWADELSRERPVVVYCAYGFHVGCNVTRALRERGFDASFIRGGVSAWYAAGGPRALHAPVP